MQSLLELAPLIAFGIAFYLDGIYTATATLMVAMVLLLIVDYARTRRIPVMHGVSAALVIVFGAATLLLHDIRFIKWKPTVFYWLAALAFMASNWIGKEPLVKRMLAKVLEEKAPVAPEIWRRLNWLWVGFWLLLGALNLVIAFNTPLATWAWFKVLGPTLGTAIFVAIQLAWLSRQLTEQPAAKV